MDEAEELSLKLIAKLEQLEGENAKLSNSLQKSLTENVLRENALEDRISMMMSQLENARADIMELEANANPTLSQAHQVVPSSSLRIHAPQATPTLLSSPSHAATTMLAPSSYSPDNHNHCCSIMAPSSASEVADLAPLTSSSFVPIDSRDMQSDHDGLLRRRVEELELSKKSDDQRSKEMAKAFAVLTAQYQNLFATVEEKSSSLTSIEREFEAYRKKRTTELRQFEQRLADVVSNFERTQVVQLADADEKKQADENELAQSHRLIATMVKEIDRKGKDMKLMKEHTERIAENYNVVKGNARLEMEAVVAQLKEKDGDILRLERQKSQLKKQCYNLLELVETQQSVMRAWQMHGRNGGLVNITASSENDDAPVDRKALDASVSSRSSQISRAGAFASRRAKA